MVILLHFVAECNEKEKGDHIPNASAIHKYNVQSSKSRTGKRSTLKIKKIVRSFSLIRSQNKSIIVIFTEIFDLYTKLLKKTMILSMPD